MKAEDEQFEGDNQPGLQDIQQGKVFMYNNSEFVYHAASYYTYRNSFTNGIN